MHVRRGRLKLILLNSNFLLLLKAYFILVLVDWTNRRALTPTLQTFLITVHKSFIYSFYWIQICYPDFQRMFTVIFTLLDYTIRITFLFNYIFRGVKWFRCCYYLFVHKYAQPKIYPHQIWIPQLALLKYCGLFFPLHAIHCCHQLKTIFKKIKRSHTCESVLMATLMPE